MDSKEKSSLAIARELFSLESVLAMKAAASLQWHELKNQFFPHALHPHSAFIKRQHIGSA